MAVIAPPCSTSRSSPTGLSITVHMSVLLGSSPGGVEAWHQGLPQVQQGVGAPRAPALGRPRRRGPGSWPRPRERVADAEVGRAGRRRGGRAPASRRSRRSTARCRAARAARRAYVVAVGAAVERDRRRRPARAASADEGPAAGARHRQRLGVDRRRASRRREEVGQPARRLGAAGGRAAATSRAATVRAPATLTCWPSTVRTAISSPSTWPGTRSPGGARTSGPTTGSPAKRVVDGDRVAVGVEQPAGALDRGAGVAEVGEPEGAGTQRGAVAVGARRRARAGRCRARGAGRGCGRTSPAPAASTPGTAWAARKSSSAPAGERRADGEPHA